MTRSAGEPPEDEGASAETAKRESPSGPVPATRRRDNDPEREMARVMEEAASQSGKFQPVDDPLPSPVSAVRPTTRSAWEASPRLAEAEQEMASLMGALEAASGFEPARPLASPVPSGVAAPGAPASPDAAADEGKGHGTAATGEDPGLRRESAEAKGEDEGAQAKDEGAETNESAEAKGEGAEARNEVAETQEEGAEARSEVAEAKGGDAETKGEVAEARSEVAEAKGGDAETKGEVAEAKHEVAEAKSGVAEARSESAEAKGGDAEAKGEVAETKGGDAEARSEVTEAKGEGAETKGEVAEARSESAEAKGGDAEAKGESAEAKGGDAEAKGEGGEATKEATEAKSGVAEARSEVAEAKGEGAEARSEVAEAKGGDAEAKGGDAEAKGEGAEAKGESAEAKGENVQADVGAASKDAETKDGAMSDAGATVQAKGSASDEPAPGEAQGGEDEARASKPAAERESPRARPIAAFDDAPISVAPARKVGGSGQAWLWGAVALIGGAALYSYVQREDPKRDPAPGPAVTRAERDDAPRERTSGVPASRERVDGSPDAPAVDPVDGNDASPSGDGARPQPEDAAEAAPVEDESQPDQEAKAPASTPPTRARSTDPREPPPGTPPEVAEVFRKIPVSAADKAPIGGIGKSGIHVDDIQVGAGYSKGECDRIGEQFSIAEGDRVNVCVRVVHHRQKEELVVLWQKDGGTVRRGKLVVPPAHAYRTRAYLMLRGEYVGTWTVRILSEDGVELAAHPFTVVQ